MAVAASLVFGVEPTAPPNPESPLPSKAQETVQVVVVQIPILATYRNGRPVTDLTLDELVLKVDGRRVPVRSLEREHRSSSSGDAIAPVRLYVEAPGGWQLPHVSAGSPNYAVFFLDVQNDNRMQRDKAIDQVIEFATTKLDPTTYATVLSFDGAFHVDLPFTTDRNALSSVLRQSWAGSGRAKLDLQAEMRDLLRQLDECVRPGGGSLSRVGDESCLRQVTGDYVAQVRPRSEEFLQALTGAVQFLGGLRGHKSVYALSHGVLVDPSRVVAEAIRSVLGNTAQVSTLQLEFGAENTVMVAKRQLLETAVRNRVTLNFLDRMNAPSQDTGAASGRLRFPGTFPTGVLFDEAQAELQEFAVQTGGVFVATSDVNGGLGQIRDMQDGVYEVSYQLDHAPSNASRAVVELSSLRKGIKLRYQPSYQVVVPEATRALRGRILVGRSKRQGTPDSVGLAHDFVIEVDPTQLGYKKDAAEMAATFTLDVFIEDDQGRERVSSYHLIRHSYPMSLWKKGDVAPITIRGWVELPPGQFMLRALIRNTDTGWSGSLDRPLSVEPSPSG